MNELAYLGTNNCYAWSWFVRHQSLTYVAQQSVTKIKSVTIMNLVTPKAEAQSFCSTNRRTTKIISLIFINLVARKALAKHELLFNKPVIGQL